MEVKEEVDEVRGVWRLGFSGPTKLQGLVGRYQGFRSMSGQGL
jgi:hypothetical protein